MTNIWYHISWNWSIDRLFIKPQKVRADNSNNELERLPCICVAPTVEQCLIAVGDLRDYPACVVYRTAGRPLPCGFIFDYNRTHEHRFFEPRTFIRVCVLDVKRLVSEGADFKNWKHYRV